MLRVGHIIMVEVPIEESLLFVFETFEELMFHTLEEVEANEDISVVLEGEVFI